MHRRGFLQRLTGAVAAVVAAPLLPAPVPARPVLTATELAFHPDAFHLAMGTWTVPWPPQAYPYRRVGDTIRVGLPHRFR